MNYPASFALHLRRRVMSTANMKNYTRADCHVLPFICRFQCDWSSSKKDFPSYIPLAAYWAGLVFVILPAVNAIKAYQDKII